jgi:transposase-like protein
VKQEMNLVKLIEQFGSEDRCRERLAELRWPNGVRCPRCDTDKVTPYAKRDQYDCRECDYRFSVTSGTIFADSKLPLWKWFLATYLMCESRKGISANQLKRSLSVTYKTAWYLCHRIRAAMKDEGDELLSGIVEVDETFVGGKPRYHRHGQQGWRGNKTMVIGAIERGGKLRVKATSHPYATQRTAEGFISEVVADDAEAIFTDDAHVYHRLGDDDTTHETVNHSQDEWVRGHIHTNTIESAWSLFDRAVIGSYHKLSVKHLPAYLDEFAFRFNNRENPYLFRDTMIRLVQTDPLTYKKLVDKAA